MWPWRHASQKRDRHRLQLVSRNTPHRSIETSKTWTRLTKRLENKHVLNICKGGVVDSGAGRQERLCCVAMKPKLLCIHNYYSCLCQVFPLRRHHLLGHVIPEGRLDAPTVSTICSRCHVWAFKLQNDYIVPLLQRCKNCTIVTSSLDSNIYIREG